MKKYLVAGFFIIGLVLAGFFIPLSTYESKEYVCGGPTTIRLHLIKGDSIEKSKNETKFFQPGVNEGVCASNGPIKFQLYFL
jgi:hypothetical protein